MPCIFYNNKTHSLIDDALDTPSIIAYFFDMSDEVRSKTAVLWYNVRDVLFLHVMEASSINCMGLLLKEEKHTEGN